LHPQQELQLLPHPHTGLQHVLQQGLGHGHGAGQQGLGQQGLGQQGLGQQGLGQHGFGQHGLGQQGLGQHGFGQQGFGQQGFGQQGVPHLLQLPPQSADKLALRPIPKAKAANPRTIGFINSFTI